MRIFCNDNIPLAEHFFSGLGELITGDPRAMNNVQLRDIDMLIVRSVVPINRDLLEGSRVQFVGTCTAGYDHFDTEYLDSQKIHWHSAPGCNANSVVEYIFSVVSRLNIDWLQKSFGIIGCGNVGGLLLNRLHALGIECRGYDPFLTKEDNPFSCSFEEVIGSDIVCVHTPLTFAGPHPTYHMISRQQLNQLRPDAVLINAGRGSVIDNNVLLDHLKKRGDLTVVLDVWENEPDISIPLLQRVALATPHIAGHSLDGKVKGTALIYRRACEFLGRSPELKAADFDRQQEQIINLNATDLQSSLNQAILSAYDVTVDYQQLLNAINLNAIDSSEKVGSAFDRLRKHYPVRREFPHFRVNLPEPSNRNNDRKRLVELRSKLEILGFRLTGD